MNAERFTALADAYGGDMARWPADVHDAAMAWRAVNAQAAMAILADAAAVDLWLDASEAPAPGLILRTAIIASERTSRPPVRRTAIWVSATGLVAACAAGIILGANLSGKVFADPAAESVAQTATAFDSVSYFYTSTTTGSAG